MIEVPDKYEDAKHMKAFLEESHRNACEVLASIIGNERNSIGLTSDTIKQSDAYIAARREKEAAFDRIRWFNVAYVKKFARDIRAERRLKENPCT